MLLQKVSESFPEPNSGTDVIVYPYEHYGPDVNPDGSKFSMWVPKGTKYVRLNIEANRPANLMVNSTIPEIGSFTYRFDSSSLKNPSLVDTWIKDDGKESKGRWIFFEFSNGAVPNAYYTRYIIDTTVSGYTNELPDTHPSMPISAPDDVSEDDTSQSNGNEDRDNPFEFLDPSNRDNPFAGSKTPEIDSQKGYQQAMEKVQQLSAAELSEDNYLRPRLNLSDLDLVPSGSNGTLNAHGYAMLEVNNIFFIVVPDSLGRLSLMPISEVGVRPYCLQVDIDVQNNAWYCDAFEIVQDFFQENNIDGVQQLQNWYNEGLDIIFYIGFAPGGNWDEFQGASFQIVP